VAKLALGGRSQFPDPTVISAARRATDYATVLLQLRISNDLALVRPQQTGEQRNLYYVLTCSPEYSGDSPQI